MLDVIMLALGLAFFAAGGRPTATPANGFEEIRAMIFE